MIEDLFHLFMIALTFLKQKTLEFRFSNQIKICATELWMIWMLNEMFCSLLHSLSIISIPAAWLRKKWSQRTILKLYLWIMQGSFPDNKPVASCEPRKILACNKFFFIIIIQNFSMVSVFKRISDVFSDTTNHGKNTYSIKL